jgi:hypothetical protein
LFVTPVIVAKVWKLVKDLKQAGAHITDFHPGDIAANEMVPDIQQGFLWVDFQNPYWIQLRHKQSVPTVIHELTYHFFGMLRHFSSEQYKPVFEDLVSRVCNFKLEHQFSLHFPTEEDFDQDCLQGLLDEHCPCAVGGVVDI